VVIPVYNERDSLLELVGRVVNAELDMDREIVLVDDGSTDGTREIYPQIEKQWPKITFQIKLMSRNRGKGAALQAGFALTKGDVVIVQDADLEYDPADYTRLLAPILAGKADVVYGSRFIGGDAHRVHYFWHMVGNKLLTLLSNMFTNLNLTDMETCYKVFRKEVLDSINLVSNRFTIEPEITAKVARGGWRIYEVGISYAGRSYAEGKKITWKDGLVAFWAIIRFRVLG
jgi:glycosyltransferase involved in cell wall biosynthesis